MPRKVSLTLLACASLLAPFVEFSTPVDLARVIWGVCAVLGAVLLVHRVAPHGWLVRHAGGVVFLVALGSAVTLAGSVLSPHEPLTGDEPAYLVIASSLAHDRDLDVSNNYRQKDYQAFGVPAYRVFGHRASDGRILPHHGPGLGWLLAPFAILVERVGAGATVLAMRIAMGMALGVYLAIALALARARGTPRPWALAAMACAALSCPLLFYSTQLYPDVPGGALLAWLSLAWIRAWQVHETRVEGPPMNPIASTESGFDEEVHHAETPAVAGALGLGSTWPVSLDVLALAALPLLGVKFIPPTVILGAALIWVRWRRARIRQAATLLLAILAGLTGYWLTRAPTPLSEHLTADAGARLAIVPWWWLGYLVDQRAGLIFLAPVYLVMAAGLRWLRWRRDGVILLAAASYLGIYAYHLDWGGLCPPGRPLVAVLWLAIVILADGMERAPRATAVLAVLSGWMSCAYAFDHHQLFLHLHPNAQAVRSPLLTAWSLPGLDLTELAPFFSVDHTATLPNLVAALILVTAATLLMRSRLRGAGGSRPMGKDLGPSRRKGREAEPIGPLEKDLGPSRRMGREAEPIGPTGNDLGPSRQMGREADLGPSRRMGTEAEPIGPMGTAPESPTALPTRSQGDARPFANGVVPFAVVLGVAVLIVLWAARLDPSSHLTPIHPGDSLGLLFTEAGPEWTDGWLPAHRKVSCWLRLGGPAKLTVLSLVDTRFRGRGRGWSADLDLRAGVPTELLLPRDWIARTERIEVESDKDIVPSAHSGSVDRRPLSVRIGLAADSAP